MSTVSLTLFDGFSLSFGFTVSLSCPRLRSRLDGSTFVSTVSFFRFDAFFFELTISFLY